MNKWTLPARAPSNDRVRLTWSQVKSSRITVPDHVVFRVFAHEIVLLNIDTGQYHGIPGSGGRVFEVLLEASDLQAAWRDLTAEFDADEAIIRDDLVEFCEDLVFHGLIHLCEPG